ncbi:MAG: HipA N-terminal domain-containing protein [Candidatus Eisenbacteria sp.]|nr:HipA N-terminal domain-containing protein [Candidatus Eisenbacteria bacterium]
MRSARVLVHGRPAGVLTEIERNRHYRLAYDRDYEGPPISLALPSKSAPYEFDRFPPFFDGLLPEGDRLEALLRLAKIDRDDPMSQLLAVGRDLVGAVTVEPADEAAA